MSGQRPRRGRLLALATLLLAASLLAASTTGLGEPSRAGATGSVTDAHFVAVEEGSTEKLWPYTSRRKSVDFATLPINVVVVHDAAFVRFLLTESSDARWNVTEDASARDARTGSPPPVESSTDARTPAATGSTNATRTPDGTPRPGDGNASRRIESGVAVNGTSIRWVDARGSTRYTYIYDPTVGRGRWVDETYQLHEGDYLGTRYHARVYEGGSGANRWTALQVHREHWDWFRLRHTVDSVDRGREHLETAFRESGFGVSRTWYANDGPIDSDGWVTSIDVLGRPLSLPGLGLAVVALASALPGGGSVGRVRTALRGQLERGPAGPRHIVLLASLTLLVLGVRVASIAVEQSAAGLSPKIIAAVFYPLLVLGTPACAVLLARGLEPIDAALTAAVGFGAGIAADYAYVGVASLPMGVVLHRTVLVTTVALFAAGGARAAAGRPGGGSRWNELLAVATLQWVVALLIPLFDLL